VPGTVLFCAGEIGHRALACFLEAHPTALAGVCSYRVEPPQERYLDEIRRLAERNGVPFREGDAAAAIAAWKPDLLYAIKWRTMLPVAAARLGLVVFHAALLPRYRGFAPIPWPIINGEHESGVTMFYAADEVDSGDIIDQRRFAIDEDDDAATVEAKVSKLVATMLCDNHAAISAGTAPRRAQDHAQATYCVWRGPDDGRIDWRAPARRIHDLVRALTSPYPGAFTELAGRRLTVWKTTLATADRVYVGSIPGRVERILPGRAVNVLTGDGAVGLVDVQLDGEPIRKAWDVIPRLRTTLG
jgi:methionyl-tRNA formyltransferase